jgi:hypothetical protein
VLGGNENRFQSHFFVEMLDESVESEIEAKPVSFAALNMMQLCAFVFFFVRLLSAGRISSFFVPADFARRYRKRTQKTFVEQSSPLRMKLKIKMSGATMKFDLSFRLIKLWGLRMARWCEILQQARGNRKTTQNQKQPSTQPSALR